MVLAFFDQKVDRAWLCQVMESSALGTPGFKVLHLQQQSYDVTYAAATDERALTRALAEGVPPIALVHTTALPHWERETSHAVVVIAMDADHVTLNDPAFPAEPQVVARDTLMLAWLDFDGLYAIIRPQQ